MKKLIILLFAIIFLTNSHLLSAEKEKFFKPWGSNKNSKNDNSKATQKGDIFKQKTFDNNKTDNILVYTGIFDHKDEKAPGKKEKSQNLFGWNRTQECRFI